MTGDRSNLSARTFLLPQPQAQPQAQPQQPFNDGVQALEGLQHVNGQTSDYFKKVLDLKSFMQSVQQNLGIDVRVPDLSRPESIKLNEIYRNALADIQGHGNMLKQSAGINTMLLNRGDYLTDSYYGKAAAESKYGQDFFNRNLEPSITELNNKLQMPSYTESEYKQKEAARQDAINYWTKFIEDNPDKAEYGQYQLRGISPTTQGMYRPYAPSTYDRSWGKKVNTAGNYLKKTTNLFLGTDDSYSPNNKVLDQGMPVLESHEFRGRRVGAYTLEGWQYWPHSKTAYILLKDPKTGGVVKQAINAEDAQTVAGGLGNVDINAMAEYTDKNKLVDDYQTLNKVAAAGFKDEKTYNEKLEANIKKSKDIYEQNTKVVVEDLKRQLSSMKSASDKGFAIFNNNDEITLGRFKIAKTKEGWEITNIKEALPLGNQTPKQMAAVWSDRKKWDTLDSLVKFLVGQGIINDLSQGTDQIPNVGTESAATDVPKQFNPADY